MALLFLSTMHGRAAFQAQNSSGEFSVHRRVYPERKWVRELAQAHGLLHLFNEQRSGEDAAAKAAGRSVIPAGTAAIVALAHVVPGQLANGVLTQWSAEELFLRDFFHQGQESLHSFCSLRIRSIVAFDPVLESHCPVRFTSDLWQPDTFSWEQLVRLCGLNRQDLEHKLHVSAEVFDSFLAQPICLRVPLLPLDLAMKHAWSCLMLKGAEFCKKGPFLEAIQLFQQKLEGFPPQRWASQALHMKSAQRLPSAFPLGVQEFRFQAPDAQKLAYFLRQHCGVILGSISDQEQKAECQLQLEEFVLRLDNMSEICHGPQRTKRSHEVLLNALCASMYLRDRSKLAETFRLTLGCMPGVAEGLGVDQLPKLPSASQISESQFQIDAAFCCFWKDRFQELAKDCVIYMWADSSPQGGTDWLLSMMRVISGKHLQACVEAADLLQRTVQDLCAETLRVASQEDDQPGGGDTLMLQDIIQERHEAGLLLQQHIVTHRQIPMAQGSGSGATTLVQKLVCMCRKFVAETHSHTLTKEVMRSVHAFCTDLGTEVGFSEQLEGYRLADSLPAWMQEFALESDQGTFLSLEEEEEDAFLFPNALPSPGMLHISHNMLSDIHKSLKKFSDWLPGFKALAALFHHKHLRKRYLASCVLNTPWAWMSGLLRHGVPKPALWRWGTVQKLLPALLLRKRLLQLTWDASKFGQEDHAAAADGAAEDEDFSIDIVSRSVKSEAFWLYTCTLSKLNEFPAALDAWAEGCSCHPWLIQNQRDWLPWADVPHSAPDSDVQVCDILEGARKILGYKSGEGDGKHFGPCPLAGQRAVHLASGEIWRRIDAWSETFLQEILEGNSCQDPAEIQSALEDFSSGKAQMVEYLQQKLQCWESLPWCLAALNTGGPAARKIASDCLAKYDAQLAAGASDVLHHRLTSKFFKPDSAGRQELLDFANGADLATLPMLSSFVWKLRFVPTVERVQERDHSTTKQLISHRGRVTAPYISCRLRFEEIRATLDLPAELAKFVAAFEQVANVDSLAKRFGIWHHPLYMEAVQQKYQKRLKMSIAAAILYAEDPQTQYAQMTVSQKKRNEKKKKKEQGIQKALKKMEPQRAQRTPRWSVETVEKNAVANHLQERLVKGALYSVSHSSLQIGSLKEALQRPMPRPVEEISLPEALPLSVDIEPLGLLGGGQQLVAADNSNAPRLGLEDVVFLRIVSSRPSRRKNVELPVAERKRLHANDMCVTLHRNTVFSSNHDSCDQLGDRVCVHVEPEAARGISQEINVLALGGRSLEALDIEAMKKTLRTWSARPQLVFGLKGHQLSPEASQLLGDMVLQRAFPQCSEERCFHVNTADAALCEGLQELRSLGMVNPSRQDSSSHSWFLTPCAMSALVHMREVHKPCKIFKPAEELAALPLEDLSSCTGWELLQILWHQGWSLRHGPQKVSLRRSLPPVTRHSAGKTFYWSSPNITGKQAVAYMRALCSSEHLFDCGFVQAIHHGQPEKYYLGVLDQSHNGQVYADPLPLENQMTEQPLALQDVPLEVDFEERVLLTHQQSFPPNLVDDPLDSFLQQAGPALRSNILGGSDESDVESTGSLFFSGGRRGGERR